MTSKFTQQILGILAEPDTGGSIPVKRTASDGTIYEYRCTWMAGYGSTLTRAQYVTKFRQQPPEWALMLHPLKQASICNAALKAGSPLPKTKPTS